MGDIWMEYLGRDIVKNGKFGITNMKKSVSRAFATRAKNATGVKCHQIQGRNRVLAQSPLQTPLR